MEIPKKQVKQIIKTLEELSGYLYHNEAMDYLKANPSFRTYHIFNYVKRASELSEELKEMLAK